MSSSRDLLNLLRLELDDREDLAVWHEERTFEDELDDEARLRRLRSWNVSVCELAVARELVSIVAAYFDEDPVFWTRAKQKQQLDEVS